VETLPALVMLEELDLSETKITDRALPTIAKMPALKRLTIDNTAVTPAGLAALKELKSLRFLKVEGLKATREELAELRGKLRGVVINVRGKGWDMMPKPVKETDAGKGASASPANQPASSTNAR